MLRSLTYGVMLLLLACASRSLGFQDESLNPHNVWRMALAAKGGAERLEAIHSYVLGKTIEKGRSSRPDIAPQLDRRVLFALPDRIWDWVDYRPGAMGASVEVINLKDRTTVFTRPSGQVDSKIDSDEYLHSVLRDRRIEQLVFFMETDMVRPIPKAVREDRLGGSNGFVLDAVCDDLDVTYYLDRKSLLALRVTVTVSLDNGSKFPLDYKLENYARVNEILVPTRVAGTKRTVEINVDYDPAVFSRPGTIEAGPEQWRRRKGAPAPISSPTRRANSKTHGAEQAIAAERAHLNVTDTLTAVARAR